MPTYSYAHIGETPFECEFKMEDFEQVQSIKDEPLTECPSCDAKVKRIITSAPGFTMHGGTPKFHG